MSQDNPTQGDLLPNMVSYMLLKPAPVLDASGNKQYIPAGMTQDFAAAITFANSNPGSVVMLQVCLYKTAATVLTAPLAQA